MTFSRVQNSFFTYFKNDKKIHLGTLRKFKTIKNTKIFICYFCFELKLYLFSVSGHSATTTTVVTNSCNSLDESSQHEINEKTTQDKASSSTPASSIHDSSFEAVEAIDEEEITCDLTKIETLSDQEIVEDVAKDLREVSDALKPFTVFSDANKTTTTTQPSTGSKQTTPEVVHRELCTGSKQRATNMSPCTSTDKGDEDDCDVED